MLIYIKHVSAAKCCTSDHIPEENKKKQDRRKADFIKCEEGNSGKRYAS